MPTRSAVRLNATATLDSIKAAWPKILEDIRTPENDQPLRVWLSTRHVQPASLESDVLFLECPTMLFLDTIQRRYSSHSWDLLNIRFAQIDFNLRRRLIL